MRIRATIPARNFTPDLNTEQVVEHFEKHLAPTISFQEELAKLGKWDANWVVDPVRITPWGTPMRPHLFEEPVTVTLTAPLQPGAEIRYTLDGSAPTPASTLYTKPLVLTDTTRLRASAFRDGRAVCLESEGSFARLGPMPPAPDVCHRRSEADAQCRLRSHLWRDRSVFRQHAAAAEGQIEPGPGR